jgi:WD40 repeat protein
MFSLQHTIDTGLPIDSVSFDPNDDNYIVSSDLKLRNIDHDTIESLSNVRRLSISFSPDGKTIVRGGDSIAIWKKVSGKWALQPAKTRDESFHVGNIAISPDSKKIVSYNGIAIWIWNIDGTLDKTLTTGIEGYGVVNSVAFSSDNLKVASAHPGYVNIWDVETGKMIKHLSSSYPLCVAFSPDGKFIAAGTRNNEIILWDAKTMSKKEQLNGHRNWVVSLAFSPDSSTIVSGSVVDNTVNIWDMETKEIKQTLTDHKNTPRCVTFNKDGTKLATGSSDNHIRIYSLPVSEPLVPIKYEECPICMEAMDNAEAMVLKCRNGPHWFHLTCVENHMLSPHSSRSCPICRNDWSEYRTPSDFGVYRAGPVEDGAQLGGAKKRRSTRRKRKSRRTKKRK